MMGDVIVWYYKDMFRSNALSEKGVLALLVAGSLLCGVVFGYATEPDRLAKTTDEIPRKDLAPEVEEEYFLEPAQEPEGKAFVLPPPVSMTRMKKQGCVADGFLSGYSKKEEKMTELINRSQCYYLHRAVETWLDPPDFKTIERIRAGVKKKDIVYGMFIAEAIDVKADYYFPEEGREFDFGEMCKAGSKNYWGEHTCVPALASEEYRKYVRYITEKAMDAGVQSFMFGQIFMQEDMKGVWFARDVVFAMREYAKSIGLDVVIGAQTNDVTQESYLRIFDYIEGGVGLHRDGSIEDAPCFSRWWSPEKGGWCWALLWHERYASKANNVFIHLDWNGKMGDDMNTFASMKRADRAKVMRSLHRKFTDQDVGFLMPFLSKLDKRNPGCYGPRTGYYSPDNRYSCKDEDVMNEILKR